MDYQLIKNDYKNLTAIERILTNRGIQLQDINHYLNTTDADILEPTLINNIINGSIQLAKHIKNNSNILVIIDCDVDGYTASSILLNYLHRLFPAFVENHISYIVHEGKEHGLIDMMDYILKEKFDLVICPDSASSDYEQHMMLHKNNIDLLIIDHHEAPYESEYACVINNQLDNYPTKSLSGAGMVYKFCQHCDDIMEIDYANDYLDLVALGLVADMMSLKDFETKHIVQKGINNIQNPFIARMVEKNSYSLGNTVTPTGMAFYIAPYINATIRSGTGAEKILLFESMLEYKAYEEIPSTKRGCAGQMEIIVEQAVRNCTNVKSKQTKTRDTAVEYIENIIAKENLLKNKILAIKVPENEFTSNKNLTGLIANQLMSKYRRPVLLLNPSENEQGEKIWSGSGRAPSNTAIHNFRNYLILTNLVEYAQGHGSAFGVAIKDSNFDRFVELTNSLLSDVTFSPSYMVDFIFDANDFDKEDIIKVTELKSLYGQGLEEPYIAITGVKVTEDNVVLMSPDKSPTLKITLPNGTTLIKFKSSKEEVDSLKSKGLINLNAVGRCERNCWGGNITPQIIIEDYEMAITLAYLF